MEAVSRVADTVQQPAQPAIRRVSTYELDALERGAYDECAPRLSPSERALQDALEASLAMVDKAATASAAMRDAALAFSDEQKRRLLGQSELPS